MAYAYDAKIDGIYYDFYLDEAFVTYQDLVQEEQVDGTFKKTYVSDYTGDIIIPESVTYEDKTYRVTAIGDHAFRGCSGVTSVTIPESVTSIGSYSFRQTGLTSFTIPESVTDIGDCAFYGCENLVSVKVKRNTGLTITRRKNWLCI